MDKDGGYANLQFGQLMPLKAEMLSEWQIERLPLSKRSYSTPKSNNDERQIAKCLNFTRSRRNLGRKTIISIPRNS